MSRLVRWNRPDASGEAYGTAESGHYRYGSLSWEHVKKLMWYSRDDKSKYPTKEFRARDFKEAKMKAEKWEAKQLKSRVQLAGELVKIARELVAADVKVQLNKPLRNYNEFADVLELLTSFHIEARIPDRFGTKFIYVDRRDAQKAKELIDKYI